MHYSHRFEIDAPLVKVADFYARPANLKAITPPIPFRFLGDPPDTLGPGDELAFRTWVGLVPVVWRSRIEALPGAEEGVDRRADDGEAAPATGIAGSEVGAAPPVAGFIDRMLEGPFASWEHHHRFVALTPERTAVEDEVEARLRPHPLWGPVAAQMWFSLPLLFAYRKRKTRRLLESG